MNLTPPRLPTPRTLDAIAIAVCLVMAGLVFLLGLMPLLDQRREQRQTRQHLNEQHARVDDMEQTLQHMRERYRELERGLEEYPLRLEPIGSLNRRLARITTVANDTGLELDQLRPGQAQAGEHFQQVPVAVAGSGNYQEIAAFLHEVREQLPDVALRDIDIQGRPAPAAATSFDLKLIWYAAPGPANGSSARQ